MRRKNNKPKIFYDENFNNLLLIIGGGLLLFALILANASLDRIIFTCALTFLILLFIYMFSNIIVFIKIIRHYKSVLDSAQETKSDKYIDINKKIYSLSNKKKISIFVFIICIISFFILFFFMINHLGYNKVKILIYTIIFLVPPVAIFVTFLRLRNLKKVLD
jgi:hypothetical protein